MAVTFRGAPTSNDEYLCCYFAAGLIIIVNIIWIAIDQFPHWTVLVSEAANGNDNDLRENPIATTVAVAIFSIPMLCMMCCGVVVLPQGMFDDKRLAKIRFSCALLVLLLIDALILRFMVVAEPCYVLLAFAATLSVLPLATAIVSHIQMMLPECKKQEEVATNELEEDIEQQTFTNNPARAEAETKKVAGEPSDKCSEVVMDGTKQQVVTKSHDAVKAVEGVETNPLYEESNMVIETNEPADVESNMVIADEATTKPYEAVKAVEEVETNEPADEESNTIADDEVTADEESNMSVTPPNVVTHPYVGSNVV